MKPTFCYRILVEWSSEDESFVARVPALPGCAAHGQNPAAAAREAEKAAGALLGVMRDEGRPIPPQDTVADYSGQLRLRLPRSLHERVSHLATAEGVSINTLLLTLIAEGCERTLAVPEHDEPSAEIVARRARRHPGLGNA
jgi:antitoxin HicB